jgi:hypothetical protein
MLAGRPDVHDECVDAAVPWDVNSRVHLTPKCGAPYRRQLPDRRHPSMTYLQRFWRYLVDRPLV